MLCVGILVAWCFVQEPTSAAGDSYCLIAKPIQMSHADTRRTKEEVDTHNRVYKATCGVK